MLEPNDPELARRANAAYDAELTSRRAAHEAMGNIQNSAPTDIGETMQLMARIEPKQRPSAGLIGAAPGGNDGDDDDTSHRYRAKAPRSRSTNAPEAPAIAPAGTITGRSYAELTVMQKDALWRCDPAKFERMRRGANERWNAAEQSAPVDLLWNGVAYDALTPMQRHQLWREDEALFNSMRADWIKRGEPIIETD